MEVLERDFRDWKDSACEHKYGEFVLKMLVILRLVCIGAVLSSDEVSQSNPVIKYYAS